MDTNTNGDEKPSLLTVRGLCGPEKRWKDFALDVEQGDIVLIRGASGVGKSVMLRWIANLVPSSSSSGGGGSGSPSADEDAAEVRYNGALPEQIPTGQPVSKQKSNAAFRSHVLYVAQRPPFRQGSPEDTLAMLRNLHVHSCRGSTLELVFGFLSSKGREEQPSFRTSPAATSGPGWSVTQYTERQREHAQLSTDSVDTAQDAADHRSIGATMMLSDSLWQKPWTTLSGGEAQRMALSIALTMASAVWRKTQQAPILLLDEPTSALDEQNAQLVEQTLVEGHAFTSFAVLLTTHSDAQMQRICQLGQSVGRRVRVMRLGIQTTTQEAPDEIDNVQYTTEAQ